MLRPLPALLTAALVLAGCGPTTFSCEGLNADQTSDAVRTCAFAAELGADGLATYGDEPTAFALAGKPLSADDRPPLTAHRTARDGTILTTRDSAAIWTRGGETLRRLALGPAGGAALSPAGRWALALSDGRLLIGEPGASPTAQATLEAGMRGIGTVAATGEVAMYLPNTVPLAFSPNGARLAGIGSDHVLAVWGAVSGERLWSVPLDAEGRAVAFSPDGTRVAASTSGTAGLWDAATGAPIASWSVPRRAEAFTFTEEHLAMWFPSSQTNGVRRTLLSGQDEHYVRTRSDGRIETITTHPPGVIVWKIPD